MIKDTFKFNNETDYKQHFNPKDDYIKQATTFIAAMCNISKEDALTFVNTEVRNDASLVNPVVQFRNRDLKGNISKQSISLLKYLDYIKTTNNISAPSLTLYFNPKDKESLHSKFITGNVKERNDHKVLASKYKIEKDTNKQTYHTVLQKVLKIFNNSLSGAYASRGTILYVPSAHYSLTSITRGVASIGNAISESMIAGNRHYRDPDVTLNHLVATVEGVDSRQVDLMIKKYNLTIPSDEDIMETVIVKNIKRYWRDSVKELVIYKYIKSLNYIDKAKIIYVNSLYHLRYYNESLVRGLISNIVDRDIGMVADPKKVINEAPDWLLNLVAHVEITSLKGKKLDPDTLDIDTLNKVAIAVYKCSLMFKGAEDLFKTFFVTEVFPVSIAYIKDMIRDAIVLSDTDSTCATYQDWVEWYRGSMIVDPISIGVTAIIMTVTTQVIDHYIKKFGVNMGVSPDKASILKMKNEFFWDVFVNTDSNKHYYSQVLVQEGDVFEKPELEIKGVHLIAPTVFDIARDKSKELMMDIMTKVAANKKLSLNYYINEVLKIERTIYNKIIEGSTEVFKMSRIKDKDTYKLGPDKSPYANHILWNNVFAKKYNKAPEPSYMAISIPVTTVNKTLMAEFLDSIKDTHIRTSLIKFMKDYNKQVILTYRLPVLNTSSKGIPKELLPIVNADKIIRDNCSVLYIVLGTLGYYLKPDEKLIDIYGVTDETNNKGEDK